MINVYDIGNDNYTGNGDAVLVPTEAKLKMVAGGNYDLTMNHPMDPDGKWRHLVPGAIVKVPVPEEEIANAFAGMDADVYKVTTATDLREGPTEPSTISYPTWSETTAAQGGYSVGSKVTFGSKNYQCTYMDAGSITARVIPSQSAWWSEIPRTTPGDPVLVSLPVGSEVYFVEDVDSTWYKMSTYYGIVGYVPKSKVTYDRHLTPSETKPRFITDQLMRITNAAADTKNKTVSVTAQHVSYDLNGVIIKDISIAVASPGMALARIVDGFMIPYPGTIATNLDSETHGTYTGDIKGKSGMYALLDPDKGIVGTFDAAFRRDNWDLFVMEKTDTDRGFQLRRQKNLLGVNWTRKSDSLINRVVPVAKDEGGADLYLPEVWVDSPDISDYPVVRMEMLSMKEQVGKDKGTGDGSTWTEADLLTEMRKRAGERFSVDKVDQVITEVTVDFEMLGATIEHPEMKALESVLLYDKVRVIDESIGLDTQLTVTELEWDALKKKVTAIKISNAEDRGGRSVTGYNVQAKSIGNDKLSDEVVNGIMKQVQDIIPEYADPEATRPATVEVIDGNPTLSWGNRSIVGTVQGTAMHVTMPADPGFNPNDLSEAATDPTDNDYTMEIGSTSYKLKFSRVWNYIKGKISSVLGLTASAYGGKASTAGDADTVNGKTVGTNVPANAVFTDTWRPVVDNLTSSDTDKSLSAKQGKVLNDNTAKNVITWYQNTTLAAIGADLVTKYTGNFTAGFCAYNLTDGNPSGFYLAFRNSSLSANIRYVFTNTTGVINLGDIANKVNKAGDTMTGTLTATGFTGPLTGNVTGNCSGSAGYIVSAGTNTQSTKTSDYALGAFNVRWFTQTGKVPGQPTQYGFLQTNAIQSESGETHQVWFEQSNGDVYHRGTNASSYTNPPAFKKFLDSSNYTEHIINNLTSTSTADALSAAQGKALMDKIKYESYALTSYFTRRDGKTDTSGRIIALKNMVTIVMALGSLTLAAGDNNIGTLSSFYPTWYGSGTGRVMAVGTHGADTAFGNPVRVVIESSGVVHAIAQTAATSTLRVTLTFATLNNWD